MDVDAIVARDKNNGKGNDPLKGQGSGTGQSKDEREDKGQGHNGEQETSKDVCTRFFCGRHGVRNTSKRSVSRKVNQFLKHRLD